MEKGGKCQPGGNAGKPEKPGSGTVSETFPLLSLSASSLNVSTSDGRMARQFLHHTD